MLSKKPKDTLATTNIKFGTDGWRAIIAQDFTFENVRVCAQGVANYLKQSEMSTCGLVVGYDTRFASQEFAAEVAQVTTGNGIKTYLCNSAAPTPAVSYDVVHRSAAAGVVITASHNPPQWNGFKYKPEYGGSATPEVVAQLEHEINLVLEGRSVRTCSLSKAQETGLLCYIDPSIQYIASLEATLDLAMIRNGGLKVAVDSMYGSGAGYIPKLLSGGSTSTVEIRSERNPAFPGVSQPEPIAPNLGPLVDTINQQDSDIGIALDGDADRLGIIDENGQFITTLQAFSLLCLYWLEVRGKRGPIVKSVTQSRMVNRLGELYQVPVYETPVGFKHIGPVMMRENALAAGEESGGYAFRGHIPERDGILSSLLIVDMLLKTGKYPSELVNWLHQKVGPHHFYRWDIPFPEAQRKSIVKRITNVSPDALAGRRVRHIDTQDGYKYILDGNYWAMVRFSGTEPLVRLYAETETPENTTALLGELRNLAGL